MQIAKAVLQHLIDCAYELTVKVHYEDVPEQDAEQPLLTILRQIKKDLGLEPTGYGPYEDPQLLLGRPFVTSTQFQQDDTEEAQKRRDSAP